MEIRKCREEDVPAVGRFYDRVVEWLDGYVNGFIGREKSSGRIDELAMKYVFRRAGGMEGQR